MIGSPGISVIVPVYNVEKYLEKCLDSVFAQTLESFEVICVDDGSMDSSPAILARYAAEHENMRVIRKENGGLSSARNAGLDVAAGEYICFVDSDDRLLGADALSRLMERADKTQADLLNFGGEVEFETEAIARARRGLRQHLHIAGNYPDGLTGQELYVRLADGRDYIPSVWTHLVSRDFLEANRIRFAEGLLFEDQLFTLQCFSLAQSTATVAGHFYLYCVREGSIMTASKFQRQADSYYRIAGRLAQFYREHLSDASDAFRKRYFSRVRLLAEQGTDCLIALPRTQRRALLRALDAPARRIARGGLARLPGRMLYRCLRSIKRKARRLFK